MTHTRDHTTAPDAALAARYRQRRLALLAVLLAAAVIPVVALGAWWAWPLLVVPAALAAPLAGGTGLMATLLASAIGLAAASSGTVASAELATGFLAIVVVAGLGAAHAGMTQGVVAAWAGRSASGAGVSGPAPREVFDLIAHRDCRRAAETGSPVSVAIVAVPGVQGIEARHGAAAADDLLDACSAAVSGVAAGSDMVMEDSDGRYVALVAGTADAAGELAERMATAIESVAVRDRDGLRVTAGEVALGVAQWSNDDTGPDSLIERAAAALRHGLMTPGRPGASDDQVTGEFRSAAIPDAA